MYDNEQETYDLLKVSVSNQFKVSPDQLDEFLKGERNNRDGLFYCPNCKIVVGAKTNCAGEHYELVCPACNHLFDED